MILDEVQNLLETNFKNQITNTKKLTTTYDNEQEDPDIDKEYAHVSIIEGISVAWSVSSVANKYRQHGTLVVKLYTPVDLGLSQARSTANEIGDCYTNIRITSLLADIEDIRFQVPRVFNLGKDPIRPLWQMNVTCPFRFFYYKSFTN